MRKKVLLVPALDRGVGTGHLKRCLSLMKKIDSESFILTGLGEKDGLLQNIPVSRQLPRHELNKKVFWDFILLDRMKTSISDLKLLYSFGPAIGLDEGGPARRYFPYLIDTLPGSNLQVKANVSSLRFLDLPVKRKLSFNYPFHKILVTFGGEDPADLSNSLLQMILKRTLFNIEAVTVVEGPCFESKSWPRGLKVIRNPSCLKEDICKYDLVFTSFGMTCFEALSAGVPVILLNPTAYHRKLSLLSGIPEIGIKKPKVKKLRKMLKDRTMFAGLLRRVESQISNKDLPLDKFLLDLVPDNSLECPACEAMINPAIARYESRSYFRCQNCGIIYLVNFSGNLVRYEEEYFDCEYKAQYGKTYLEDFPVIKARALQRIKLIKKVDSGKEEKSLLDVGCAYGPFLQAASEEGFRVSGIDVSRSAVKYVNEVLHIRCETVSFEDFTEKVFDVVTMWYVIEHLKTLRSALTKVNRLLPKGGVFAFSTPNFSGISGRTGRESFFMNSPVDHFSVWTPGTVRRLLPMFGFGIRKISVTGHHPERFFPLRNLDKKGAFWRTAAVLSRIFRLGDTFEVYSVKEVDV